MASLDLQDIIDENGSILTTSPASHATEKQAIEALLKRLTAEAEKHIIVTQSERPSRISGSNVR